MIPGKKIFQLVFLLLASICSNAQTLQFEKVIHLSFNVDKVSTDREGFLYITSHRGSIFKYSQVGDSVLSYSPVKNSEITLIEAWSGLKIFIFYRDFQEYVLLDRFLRPSPHYSFNPQYISYALLATFASDNNIWVIDPGDFSIKKYNSKFNIIDYSMPLDLIMPVKDYNITYIKEYQNLLFVTDSNSGIYIFDNLGNYQKKIPLSEINQLGFIDNHIYFLNENGISILDIYTGKKQIVKIPPMPECHAKSLIVTASDMVYLFEENRLFIYRIQF